MKRKTDSGPDLRRRPENPDDVNDDLTPNTDNLAYNEEENSFEIDVKSDDPDYDHPDPYHTAVKNGGDFDSTYDEANPTAVDEYEEEDPGLEEIGMRIGSKKIIEVSPVDEMLAQTPEDELDNLDEEGYPKNDDV
jgi:hypothetical protein